MTWPGELRRRITSLRFSAAVFLLPDRGSERSGKCIKIARGDRSV